MNRRNIQLAILCSTLIALMMPISIGSTQAFERESSGGDWVRSTGLNLSSEFVGEYAQPASSSLEYEFPAPPPERTREDCKRISRFCNWLASHGSLVESDEDESFESADVDDSDDVASNGEQAAANGSTSDENRSVVSWQSASVSTMENSTTPDPAKLEVPSLSISADVTDVGIDADRAMQVPDDFNTVGWYRYGPRPGQDGSSVFAGHLDDAQGRSVFYDLQFVDILDEIMITMDDGSVQTWQVTAKVSYDATNLPRSIFSREGDPQLALITCAGTWDSSAGRYTETMVVFATPVS